MRTVSLLFHDVYDADPRESGFASEAADRYKLPLTDFDAQLEGLTGFHRDDFRVTVDDGGLSYYTHVADRLERQGWRGICFVTTNLIATPGFLDAQMLRELDRRGHVIGTHSLSHPKRFSALKPDAMQREWGLSRAILEDILGHPVTVGSVPGGYFSHTVARSAAEAGLRTLFTSEPTTSVGSEYGCTLLGRFTIRKDDANSLARRLVAPAPWTRWTAWASWNAKGLVKPLLGTNYMRVADWLLAHQSGKHA
jgi:peptidoglycan/xylan/chitin deacetylase (PgdA/CDA1 family)